MVFVLPHSHFDWTRNPHPRFLFPAKLSEYHGGVITIATEAEFSRFLRKQVGEMLSSIFRVWLKFSLNTICCGEQSRKMKMSPIRRRFVPALISHDFHRPVGASLLKAP
jgi:hypothetical protein